MSIGMFGFIKNLFKPKTSKEVKQEYKRAGSSWIIRYEDVEGQEKVFKANEIVDEIFQACLGTIRPGQTFCPPLVIPPYKKLLVLGDEEALVKATDILGMYLSEVQQQDFMNKVRQLKEYKEWRMKKRLNELEEDFK